jgi:AcrR family transcriptional regulator
MSAKSERTRERILRAAERLFAQHGYDGVSVRDIGAAAKAQIALISYYFKNKEGLYRAIFQRRIEPVSVQRRAALQQLLARKKPPATIADVLDALARPWVELRDRPGGQHYTRLIAREVGDPNEARRGIVKDMLDPIAEEFIAAMEQVLPGRPRADNHWAYHFFIGALLLMLVNPERTQRLSGKLCDMSDGPAVLDHIVGFFSRALEGDKRSTKRPNRPRARQTKMGKRA